MVFFKGDEPHDYKFSEAVFEDYSGISPEWRNRCTQISRDLQAYLMGR